MNWLNIIPADISFGFPKRKSLPDSALCNAYARQAQAITDPS